jgi:hypothetical protein
MTDRREPHLDYRGPAPLGLHLDPRRDVKRLHGRDRGHVVDLTPRQRLATGGPRPADAFRNALARAPFQALADLMLEVGWDLALGDPVAVQDETFVPFVVTRVFGSRLNLEPVVDDQIYPKHLFRLRDVIQIVHKLKP